MSYEFMNNVHVHNDTCIKQKLGWHVEPIHQAGGNAPPPADPNQADLT